MSNYHMPGNISEECSITGVTVAGLGSFMDNSYVTPQSVFAIIGLVALLALKSLSILGRFPTFVIFSNMSSNTLFTAVDFVTKFTFMLGFDLSRHVICDVVGLLKVQFQ